MKLHLERHGGTEHEPSPAFSGRAYPPRPASPPRRTVVRRVFGGIGWLFGGGADWAGAGPIRRGVSLIGALARQARNPSLPRGRIYTDEDATIDLEATAFSLCISVSELSSRLARRRQETARLAYVMFGLGVLCLLGWLHAAQGAPLTASRVMLVFDFLPFCALFFLMSFYEALVNYQIRAGRQVGWREFLMAERSILPQ